MYTIYTQSEQPLRKKMFVCFEEERVYRHVVRRSAKRASRFLTRYSPVVFLRSSFPKYALLLLSCVSGCLSLPEAQAPATETTPGEGSTAVELLSRATKVGEIYPVGELRSFEFYQGERMIGRSWGRYEGVVKREGRSLHHFSTRIELLPASGSSLRSATEVYLDETGELVEGVERSVAAELRFRVQDEMIYLEAFTGLLVEQKESFKFAPGMAFMSYMAIIHQELMYNLRDLPAGQLKWPMVSLSSGRPDQWSAQIQKVGEELHVQTSLGEFVRLRGRRIESIEIEDDELAVRPSMSPSAWPDWEIERPKLLTYEASAKAGFTRREVELPGRAGEPRLAGEVLIPTDADEKHPVPGVIFLAGSAPADRYGHAGPPAVDLGSHEITDALAEAGFAVLRYDERGRGASQLTELTWKGQQEDARRAFRTLLIQPEVDPNRILVVGHGEGGWRALQMAIERPREIVGAILLATSGRSYRERLAGQPELIKNIESGEGLPPLLAQHATWYREILDVDPRKLIAGTPCPIWVAQGDKDFETDPKRAPAVLRSAARKHKRKLQITHFPKLDHLFKVEPGTSSHTRYLEERPVDPDFLRILVKWAKTNAR